MRSVRLEAVHAEEHVVLHTVKLGFLDGCLLFSRQDLAAAAYLMNSTSGFTAVYSDLVSLI